MEGCEPDAPWKPGKTAAAPERLRHEGQAHQGLEHDARQLFDVLVVLDMEVTIDLGRDRVLGAMIWAERSTNFSGSAHSRANGGVHQILPLRGERNREVCTS